MSKAKTIEQFKQDVYNMYGSEYIVLSNEYKNNKTKVMVRHNTKECEYYKKNGKYYDYPVTPNEILYGSLCPKCANKKRGKKNIKPNYLETLLKNAIDGNEYQWMEKYKNDNKLLHDIKHLTCCEIYPVRPNDFQQGYRCPNCAFNQKMSKNCKIVKKYLDEKNINYDIEVTFEDCKDKRVLPFDFKINNLILEIDGAQHFHAVKSTIYTNEKVEINKNHDKIKNEFIFNSNYDFIRLHYKLKENDIISILDSYFNNNIDYNLINKKSVLIKKNDLILNKESYYTNCYKNYYIE